MVMSSIITRIIIDLTSYRAFQFLVYMITLATDKMNGCGLRNKASHNECLLKKTVVTLCVLDQKKFNCLE